MLGSLNKGPVHFSLFGSFQRICSQFKQSYCLVLRFLELHYWKDEISIEYTVVCEKARVKNNPKRVSMSNSDDSVLRVALFLFFFFSALFGGYFIKCCLIKFLIAFCLSS